MPDRTPGLAPQMTRLRFGYRSGGVLPEPLEVDAGTDTALFLGDLAWRKEHLPRGLDGCPDANGAFVLPNLEGPIVDSMHRPRFRPSRVLGLWNDVSVLEWLRSMHGAAVGLANNHVDDYVGSLSETLHRLSAAGIAGVGGGHHLGEALRPLRLLMSDGGALLIVALSDDRISSRLASWSRPGSAHVPPSEFGRFVRVLRRRYPDDVLIVLLHWGMELQPLPSPEQRRAARQLIDGGVNVIVGHHPHVWQGWESFDSGVCVYSLGDFLVSDSEAADGVVASAGKATSGYGLVWRRDDLILVRHVCDDPALGVVRVTECLSRRKGEWLQAGPHLTGAVDERYERLYRRRSTARLWYPVWTGRESPQVRALKRLQLSSAHWLRWAVRRGGRAVASRTTR